MSSQVIRVVPKMGADVDGNPIRTTEDWDQREVVFKDVPRRRSYFKKESRRQVPDDPTPKDAFP